MNSLRKPPKLAAGDTIATVSPSWGIAGDPGSIGRYRLGKKRLEELFGLRVTEAPNSLRGENYLQENPRARAEDLMWAFENREIKAIFANIGGNDSIRLLPFTDRNIIQKNPKIFLGYSDILTIHLMCYKAGLSSFYGPNLLTVVSEPSGLHPYSRFWMEKVLFHSTVIGEIAPSHEWSCDGDDLTESAPPKKYHLNSGCQLLQGRGTVRGRLMGGHTELRNLFTAGLAIPADDFRGCILFLEDIVDCVKPPDLVDFLRWLGREGILQKIGGIILGKFNVFPENPGYNDAVVSVLSGEMGLTNLPVLAGLNFGHTSPMILLPFGAEAEINAEKRSFSILESGVI